MSFNEENALFTVTNMIDPLLWKIWISAVGTDGMKSGVSYMQNIQLYLVVRKRKIIYVCISFNRYTRNITISQPCSSVAYLYYNHVI